ncbi:MAG: amidohydrolase family protein [Acidimicrobiia bacterium]
MPESSVHVETTVLPSGDLTDLWIRDGVFVEGPMDGPTIHAGGFAVPGLVDAHAHLALASPAPDADDEERARASARAHLDAGVLSVREPGSPNHASIRLSRSDGLPTVVTAGRFLTAPGRYFPGLAREVDDDLLVSAALEELGHSGEWVKVIGDFFDEAGRFSVNFSTESLRETALQVHHAGGRITMHAMIPDSIQQAIEAGFDGVEHGSIVEDGQVEAMASKQITWTPTALIDDVLRESAEEMLGSDGASFLVAGLESHGESIRQAHELGVRILAGTDAGMNPHGVVAREIRLLHSFGLSPTAALAAGSWDARKYLGLPGIEKGAPADLVIFPDDPRGDLAVLDHPALILLRGELVRSNEKARLN